MEAEVQHALAVLEDLIKDEGAVVDVIEAEQQAAQSEGLVAGDALPQLVQPLLLLALFPPHFEFIILL